MRTANLYIVSAPSGAGKTSLVKALLENIGNLALSVSHTTRHIRPGENNGIDYHFVSQAEFQQLLEAQELLEHAQVFGNYYGTAKSSVENSLRQGTDIILEIDWQGAQQIRKLSPECISIFILPPSTHILEQRLKGRGQDDAGVIARRMQDAVTEISHYQEFDYIVVNDDFNQALLELQSIVIANRLTKIRQIQNLDALIKNLLG
jgi:guanylate kinase